jgi:hypothetical protein
MLAKIPTFIMSIIMSVAALFGLPFQDHGGSSFLSPNPGDHPSLYSQLPAGATAATDAQLDAIRTGTWVSAARSSTNMIFNERVSSGNIPTQVPDFNDEFPNGTLPGDLQNWIGTGGCNKTYSYVFFSGATMNRSQFAHSTLVGCDASMQKFEDEANHLFTAKPVINVIPGNENKEIYLVTGDGAAKFVRP